MRSKALHIILWSLLLMHTPVMQAQGFSESERSYVNTQTPGLFKNSNSFNICSDDILKGGFCFPLIGSHMISDWNRGGHGVHTGVDIKTFANDTVRSAFPGVVRLSYNYGGYGNVVVVRHSFGMETVYSHNSKNLVQVGDTVRAGQPLGLEGRTGRATTEHVHFECRVNGQAFDPNWLFDFNRRQLKPVCLEVKKTGDAVLVRVKAKK